MIVSGNRVVGPGGEHPLGGGVHPDVLGDRQVLLRRVLPAQVPHQLQQAGAASVGGRLQGRPRGRARRAGRQQDGPGQRPDGHSGRGSATQQGDRMRLLPRDLRPGEHRTGTRKTGIPYFTSILEL